ncbi:hypothetical protein NEHOM01_1438 [Nematocida homosporus]|uniref:uncharacterized protein n=1 Tax=Nematocida homosporus TaxID=1912981 RepID=UPI00221E7A41|nr:uncharacterized protein NEHOM01_1438 [Nematocida homosporus]KAI5186384.1 hypothetical protein NEHOM01_1438 [Nematocida homosporus]
MVMQHIMNWMRGKEPAGNLYLNKILKLEGAAIEVDKNRIVFTTAKEKEDIGLDELEYIDFTKTTTKEPALSLTTKDNKWTFVFRLGLPGTILRFYGQIIKYIPIVNKWEVLYACDPVDFRKYNYSTDSYEVIDSQAGAILVKSKIGVFIRIGNQYNIYRKGDLIQGNSDFYIDQGTKSFSWVVAREDREGDIFRIIFGSLPSLFAFFSAYLAVGKEKESKEEKEYFEKMEIENYNEMDLGSEEEEELSSESQSSIEEVSSDEGRYSKIRSKAVRKTEESVAGNVFGGKNREKNKALAVSRDGALISKGSSIGLFRSTGNDLEFAGSISNLAAKGKKIVPQKMLIADNSSVIVSNHNDTQNLYKIDLNTEKVAETWDTGVKTRDFFAAAKTADGFTQNNEFLGVSSNAIFRLDPRAAKVMEGKTYKTDTKFSSGDASSRGEFALGSDTGDIRLYDSIEKRAKTLLPGLGDPILGVFISPSGKYVVCTCKTYLMLVTAEANGVSGFKKSLGKEKPVPKKLIIRPEHLHLFGGEANFTNASISTDAEEKFVIVSTREWVIVWDMQKVLKGSVFSYQIRQNEHNIVSNSFVPGDSDKIIVAMDDDIQMVARHTLKRPEKLHKSTRKH